MSEPKEKAKKVLTKQDILDSIKKSKSASMASEEVSSGEITAFYDTGCYALNLIISGSIFKGVPTRVVAFAGEEATGKTYIVQGIMERFLNADPEAMVEVWDTESTMNRKDLEARNIDSSRVVLREDQTVEEFSARAYQRLLMQRKLGVKEKFPMMMVLDSLGGLSSVKSLTDMESENFVKDMTKQQALSTGMVALNKAAALAEVPLLVTNHVYEKIGSYGGGKEMGGGKGLKYMASIIIFLSKSSDFNEKTKSTDGIFITANAKKSRLIKPHQKVKLRLSFATGLNPYYGLLEPAKEYGLVQNMGGKLTFPDGQEAKNEPEVWKNPEKYFTKEFLEKFEETVSPHFRFGSTISDDFPESEDELNEG